ncbi:MAG TPA: T9SS type A sorting domain-containing protein [Prolixibacteraceae bacterium]|nr:T9SS type A sorting domain-containing protein [Prolixibacteraceae bacterium]
MKQFALILFLIITISHNQALFGQMQAERLNRGAVAIKSNNGYIVSWRLLGNEAFNTPFNIYRNGQKINKTPLTNSTFYIDENAPQNSRYIVKAIIDDIEIDDKKTARLINYTEGENAAYFDIDLNQPAKGINGGNYSPNDASTGDLNGDGEYDIVLKWDPDNSKDNSQKGITDNVILDGYTLDGEQLWRIDLGPNIRAGAHYTQFLVFDFDGNGKAEIMCKTAPGTKDASGAYISKGPAAETDHTIEYRNSNGYILSGPEYITVFDGETGLELETADYWPQRGKVSDWGDNYGNRLDRYNATVAYTDGQKPTAIFQRGYYTRLSMAAWNWRDGQLSQEWTFDSNDSGNGAYYGQGNHSIHVIDANTDGFQDIVTGASVISGTGNGIHTSKMGHGDATHVTFMIKDEKRPLIYMPHENKKDGVTLRYADTGEIIFQHKNNSDVGRACAAEIDPNVPGFHFWASSGLGLYNIDGDYAGSIPNSINFVIWWDGDLSRELMNSNRIDQWNIRAGSAKNLLTGASTSSNNGTKSTPTLQADLFGDWREELILRNISNNSLRIYTTTIPTEHRLYTLMHDPVYRVAISWQNSSYNQPPHPGFYLASDMDFPLQQPNIEMLKGYYRGSGNIIKNLMVNDLLNASEWKIDLSLNPENSVYTNKTAFAEGLPEQLIGSEWISPSSNSNLWTGNDTLATFEVTSDASISVIYPEEAPVPQWLQNFEQKSNPISISTPITSPKNMVLFQQNYTAGQTVVLGPTSSSGNSGYPMYFVCALPKQNNSNSIQNHKQLHIKVYPNPVKNEATIQYRLEQSQKVNIQLFDLSGKLITNIDSGHKPQGTNLLIFNTSHLHSGIYLLKISTQKHVMQQRIIVSN